MIKIYNTLTKAKDLLNVNKLINIYTCGITVHDLCHIGHARIFIFFDIVIRYLNILNIKIIYIRNITDIDDKIIYKAEKKNVSIHYITKKFAKKMYHDIKKLNVLEPSFEPKATIFIDKMVRLILALKKNFYAYKSSNNDVYYHTQNYNKYGQLSKRFIKNIDNFDNEYKKCKSDFTLWKSVKRNEKIFWKTEIGCGRPGWHTECSAMALYYTNEYLDIHGGGEDLIFPHHENELTQCESITNKKFVNIWMHVGHLNINEEKMSKTKKNYILINDLLKKFNPEVIKFFFLLTHYRSKINFSIKNIIKAKKSLNKLYKLLFQYKINKHILNQNIINEFFLALNNDFNTPKAVSILFEYLKKNDDKNMLICTIKYLGNILGILNQDPNIFLNKSNVNKSKQYTIDNLIKKRNLARKKKNWVLADKIRNKLIKMNIIINDDKTYSTK